MFQVPFKVTLSPTLKLVKDDDQRKSNVNEFHSLEAHTEKSFVPITFCKWSRSLQ